MDDNEAAGAAGPVYALVVDDEPDIETLFRQRFRRELRAGRLILEFANSGRTALEVLENSDRDFLVILSDIEMPEMDGLELLERVHNRWPQFPVYLVTAYDSASYVQKATAGGAHGFMTKPLDFSALRQVIFPS